MSTYIITTKHPMAIATVDADTKEHAKYKHYLTTEKKYKYETFSEYLDNVRTCKKERCSKIHVLGR